MSVNSAARVFVVDDEPVIAMTVAMILRNFGFLADSFTNPVEALSRTNDDVPDLLISDVMMPEMSGVDLAIQMQSRRPICKILLVSGQASLVQLLEPAKYAGHDFRLLSKPIHPDDLMIAVRQQLAK